MAALTLTQISDVKNLIQKDLLMICSGVTSADLTYLGIPVINNVEHKLTGYQYLANESIARKYVPGSVLTSTLGNAVQRSLITSTVVSRVLDNLRNYKEKEAIETIGISSDGVTNCPIAQKNMEVLARQFCAQALRNLFFGDESRSDAYNCYNGIFKNIQTDITAGNISESKGNLQKLAAIELTANTDAAKIAAYEAFDKFFYSLDEDLQDAEQLNIAMSRKLASYITQGAALKFNSSIQGTIMQTNEGVRFFDRHNVVLKPTKLMGTGQAMIAYVPGAMEFGTDLSKAGDIDGAHIDMIPNPADTNELIYQMQVSLGTRIWLFDSTHFCAACKSDGTWNTAKTLSEGVTTPSSSTGD